MLSEMIDRLVTKYAQISLLHILSKINHNLRINLPRA